MAVVLRDAGLSALLAEADLETLADGFQFTEGPLWCPDGSLLFQDVPAGRTYRLGTDGVATVLRERTNAANGQTFLPDGGLIFCEQDGRRISRMALDGTGVQTVAEHWQGRRLNSPNDVACRSDGSAFFTDPPYGVAAEDRAIAFQGVYRLGPGEGEPQLLLDDFEKPNGLAFSPDERTLYVCDTARDHVRAFAVDSRGGVVPGTGRVFATMDPGQPGGPDGMKVDRDGRVYVAVALGLWVYAPDGALLGIIATPKRPSNLAWCGPDADFLAITAVDAVHRVRLRVRGLPPPFQPPLS